MSTETLLEVVEKVFCDTVIDAVDKVLELLQAGLCGCSLAFNTSVARYSRKRKERGGISESGEEDLSVLCTVLNINNVRIAHTDQSSGKRFHRVGRGVGAGFPWCLCISRAGARLLSTGMQKKRGKGKHLHTGKDFRQLLARSSGAGFLH